MSALLRHVYGASDSYVFGQLAKWHVKQLTQADAASFDVYESGEGTAHRLDPSQKKSAAILLQLTDLFEIIQAVAYYGTPALAVGACDRAKQLICDCWNTKNIFPFLRTLFESPEDALKELKVAFCRALADRVHIFAKDIAFRKLLIDCPQLEARLFRHMATCPLPQDLHVLRYCSNWVCRKNQWCKCVCTIRGALARSEYECIHCRGVTKTPARDRPVWHRYEDLMDMLP